MASCPQQEGLDSFEKLTSRGPENPQLQRAGHVGETRLFKQLEEAAVSTGKICSDCEGEADGDPLGQSYC